MSPTCQSCGVEITDINFHRFCEQYQREWFDDEAEKWWKSLGPDEATVTGEKMRAFLVLMLEKQRARTIGKIRKDVELLARKDEIQEHGIATGNSAIREVLNLDSLK